MQHPKKRRDETGLGTERTHSIPKSGYITDRGIVLGASTDVVQYTKYMNGDPKAHGNERVSVRR